ncbi:MAG TPA: STAS domain-containing protein [Candidatus Binatia bacterium]|jgi:rsbT antagonist protein RsbS|nr:STAS domain-containing protein [Candidatus Binatia bacterium]
MNDDVPVIRLGDTLLVTLQGDLDDAAAMRIEDRVTREVARTGAKGTLIDVSGLPIVDSFIARELARVAAMLRLLGSEAVIVGLQPAVAITLVELGLPMRRLHTALNAEQGMALLRRLRADGTGTR